MPANEVNELIHAPTRLRIMAALVELGARSDITFARLQEILEMTPGNMSAHIKRLEQAKYLTVTKSFTPRGTSQTRIRVTRQGITAFNQYVDQLTGILHPPLDA